MWETHPAHEPPPGGKVVVLEEWPLKPGSNVKLNGGDEGLVVRSSGDYCAIEVFGSLVVVPTSKLQRVDDPAPEPSIDEDWWKF